MNHHVHRGIPLATVCAFALAGSLTGQTKDCEPVGASRQRAGDPGVMVPGGIPMQLTGTGVRRSLVLILQDASQPRNTHAMDWKPQGLCLTR